MLFSMKHLVIGILGQQEVDVWILVWGAHKASLIFVSTAACQLAVHLVLGLGWEGERGQAPCHPNLPSGWTGFQGWDKVKPERWRHWPQGTQPSDAQSPRVAPPGVGTRSSSFTHDKRIHLPLAVWIGSLPNFWQPRIYASAYLKPVLHPCLPFSACVWSF